jgi:hypothetical protein
MWADHLKSDAKVAYRHLVGPWLYERLEFRRHLGYWPNLDNPQTFNEKICARKFRPFPQAATLVDKLTVRDFVTRRIGDEYLTQLYYSGDCPKSVDYAALPSKFVLKGTHGGGRSLRILVRDKSLLSRRRLISVARRILNRRCGPEVNEWWYAQITPRIVIEEMLVEEDGSIPIDFKFYVFNGVARYVQVIDGRHSETTRSRFYDRHWRAQPFTRGSFGDALDLERPSNLSEMLSIAEALGAGCDFIRVDLYSVGQRVVFGELTLAPGAGWTPFRPAAYDLILGGEWSSDPRNSEQDHSLSGSGSPGTASP